MKPITTPAFADVTGKLHPSRKEAAKANLSKAIFDVPGHRLHSHTMLKDKSKDNELMALMMELTERMAISFWITDRLELLEELQSKYVADMTNEDGKLEDAAESLP